MQKESSRTLQRHTIWLSLLGHLLLLTSFAVVFFLAPKRELPSSAAPAAVPSYLAQSPDVPSSAEEPAMKASNPPEQQAQETPKETAKEGIEKPVSVKAAPQKNAKPATPQRRAMTFSRDAVPEDITNPMDQEPLHLVGDSKIVKPLIKILARALARHLTYPRVAAELNLRGVVIVGFVLNPEGYVTEARVMKSSGTGVLDEEAREAVSAMSPVGDVHAYVEKPEFMTVGIIFG